MARRVASAPAGTLTWDDLVALGVERDVNPEAPIIVSIVGNVRFAVYHCAFEDDGDGERIVLYAQSG